MKKQFESTIQLGNDQQNPTIIHNDATNNELHILDKDSNFKKLKSLESILDALQNYEASYLGITTPNENKVSYYIKAIIDRLKLKTKTYVVASIAERDALTNLVTGDQCFVVPVSGAREDYVWNGTIWILDSSTDWQEVRFYATKAGFPVTGISVYIYIDISTNFMWRWDTTLVDYVKIGGSDIVFGTQQECEDAVITTPITDISDTKPPSLRGLRYFWEKVKSLGTQLNYNKTWIGNISNIAVETDVIDINMTSGALVTVAAGSWNASNEYTGTLPTGTDTIYDGTNGVDTNYYYNMYNGTLRRIPRAVGLPSLTTNKTWKGNSSNVAIEVDFPTVGLPPLTNTKIWQGNISNVATEIDLPTITFTNQTESENATTTTPITDILEVKVVSLRGVRYFWEKVKTLTLISFSEIVNFAKSITLGDQTAERYLLSEVTTKKIISDSFGASKVLITGSDSKPSSKSLVTSLGTDDTSIPTSKAINDVIEARRILLNAGTITRPTVTFGTNTFTITTCDCYLYSTPNFNGTINKYTIPQLTNQAITTNTYYYVMISYNSGTPIYTITTDNTIANHSDTIQVCQVIHEQPAGGIIDNYNVFFVGEYGLGLSNKISHRLIHTERFGYESGLALSETGTRYINVTDGMLWYDGSEISIALTNSNTTNYHFYYLVSSVWNANLQASYNNTQYNNAGNLASLGSNKYAVNWIFRSILDSNLTLFVVLGNGDYTLAQAQASTIPTIPTVISKSSILVGRIIVKKGDSVATQIDSAFTKSFSASGIGNHNDLAGLQGGVVNTYNHSDQPINTADSPVFTGKWTFGGITNNKSFTGLNTTITGNITLGEHFVVLSNTATTLTITLPAVATSSGRVYTIRNINTGTATIDPNASELIDGSLTLIVYAGESITIECDGLAWYIIAIGGKFSDVFALPNTNVSQPIYGTQGIFPIGRFGTDFSGAAVVNEQTTAIATVTHLIKALTSQTSQLLLLQDSSGNFLGSVEASGSQQILRGKYIYEAQSLTADTIGDVRSYTDANGTYKQICTVANAAKGLGTWLEIESLLIIGTLNIKTAYGKSGSYYDTATTERGQCILMTADEALSKGNVCSFIQGGTSNRVKKTPVSGNENDMAVGVAITSAAGAGSTLWMAVSGIVQVLPETGTTPTLGYVITTSGSVAGTVTQSASAPATATHFKEVGHWCETVAINTICKAIIHFN